MKKHLSLLVSSFIAITVLLLTGTIKAKAEGEFTKDYSQYDISLSVNNKTVSGLYSNPEIYFEDSAGGYLVSQEISFKNVNSTDKILYTPEFNLTITNRLDDVIEYACEEDGGHYFITKINKEKDGIQRLLWC